MEKPVHFTQVASFDLGDRNRVTANLSADFRLDSPHAGSVRNSRLSPQSANPLFHRTYRVEPAFKCRRERIREGGCVVILQLQKLRDGLLQARPEEPGQIKDDEGKNFGVGVLFDDGK